MRRPAWAPPPKIWISGIGRLTGAPAGQVLPQRHAGAGRRRMQRPPARSRRSRCRRGATCSACRRGRSGARRPRPGRARPCRASAGAISPRDAGERLLHVEAAQPVAAVALVDRLAASRATRRPARCRGRQLPSSSQTSASIGRPSARIPDPAAIRLPRLSLLRITLSTPEFGDVAEARRPAARGGGRPRARTALPRAVRPSGTRPATCRRSAPATAPAAAPRSAPRTPPSGSQSTPAR